MVSAPSYLNGAGAVSATQMKKLLFAPAIGLLLAGCAHYVPGEQPTPSAAGVSEKDHTATIHVGQKLELALHAPNGLNNWSHPQSSDTSVLAPTVDPAATAAIGVTLAMFIGQKPGTAEVTASATPRCAPGAPCPAYVALYSLKVTVTQ